MNVSQLAQSAYTSAAAPIRTERSTEYTVFSRITHQMHAAASKGASGFPALVKALHENRQLWVTFASDVADEDNQLPQALRAQIFYLAEFAEQHTRKVLTGSASPVPLIQINAAIMRGLSPSGSQT